MQNPTIEFKRKVSMQNGNKVTKKNWQNVVAVCAEPCTHVLGVPAIDAVKKDGGNYYEKFKLVFEEVHKKDEKILGKSGFIFREINHNGGINGRHKTFKAAIYAATGVRNIRIFLEQ